MVDKINSLEMSDCSGDGANGAAAVLGNSAKTRPADSCLVCVVSELQ